MSQPVFCICDAIWPTDRNSLVAGSLVWTMPGWVYSIFARSTISTPAGNGGPGAKPRFGGAIGGFLARRRAAERLVSHHPRQRCRSVRPLRLRVRPASPAPPTVRAAATTGSESPRRRRGAPLRGLLASDMYRQAHANCCRRSKWPTQRSLRSDTASNRPSSDGDPPRPAPLDRLNPACEVPLARRGSMREAHVRRRRSRRRAERHRARARAGIGMAAHLRGRGAYVCGVQHPAPSQGERGQVELEPDAVSRGRRCARRSHVRVR